MSYRRNRQNVTYIHWDGKPVKPRKGKITVYYWVKGDIQTKKTARDETWVKADLYDVDGELWVDGILADNLAHLKLQVAEMLDLD